MNREELIAALRRMASETVSIRCLGCGYAYNCSLNGCDIIRAAVEEIEGLRNPPNPPLTLEELREMGGEPVWVEILGCNRDSRWRIIKYSTDAGLHIEDESYPSNYLAWDTLGLLWLAYRRKPEGGPYPG